MQTGSRMDNLSEEEPAIRPINYFVGINQKQCNL